LPVMIELSAGISVSGCRRLTWAKFFEGDNDG
jgi:hypothetical protein